MLDVVDIRAISSGTHNRRIVRNSIVSAFDIDLLLRTVRSLNPNQLDLELAGLKASTAEIILLGRSHNLDLTDIMALCFHFRISIDSIIMLWDSADNPPKSSSPVIVEYQGKKGRVCYCICTFSDGQFLMEIPSDDRKQQYIEIDSVIRWKYLTK